ncbi:MULTISPECIES: RNase E specificity factor CsrD [unclassified Shewanella]|uniref:RNase E specificity factor CsrD n=1 Tax=unclassified Shewanella TaxID=196818 RepID=UPI000C84947B|nr:MULTISPECIES: RNase E specificity factor CsrD [unclassified Shewanella]MDO6618704.1 RNase E specificity factor CsrD [Shewanella sp. 6_MG-2023]MDO6678660.1 RNase E specificity factor CsrD [Shewanella sp. 4_MG-2023]MDO6775452.1 RNase E specificity factor CsrD [Shewanella sp. 3_MG-2023]PMG31833.1 RNase E specificity factor CsrD [Shewanella sp. 10N.286.52.C2]PMG42784.1 RNase E specificity factor CsrD [Shewanella sp. 10N.286.52.B9]
MKLTKMLTKKLISFWLLSLTAVGFIFLVGAMVSFTQLTYKFQQQKVDKLGLMLVEHYQSKSQSANQSKSQPKYQWDLHAWLPPMLMAFNANSFKLTRGDDILFEYYSPTADQYPTLYKHTLDKSSNLAMELNLPQPYLVQQLGWYEYISLFIALSAIGLFVRFGLRWFTEELDGIEHIAQRSHLILDGEHQQALQYAAKARPRLINRAMTKLLVQLQDAQKERGRFDQFIRSNTFLDPSTRIGNRIFFENRLEALTHQETMIAHGVVVLMNFDDLDLLQQQHGVEEVNEQLNDLVQAVQRLLVRFEESIFARYSFNQFVVVAPQLSLAEADSLAGKLLKIGISQLQNQSDSQDNYIHLGAAFYKAGDQQQQIVEEVEMALKAAQLQRNNNWFMYDKGAVDKEIAKGSVRWRSFLESTLVNRRFVTVTKKVIDSDGATCHQEVFSRAIDNQGNEVRATLFIPMANKCGLMPQIERQLIETVLFELMANNQQHFSVNLSLDSLTSRAFTRWLQTTLLEHRPLASRLTFEVAENIVVKHQQDLVATLEMLRKIGARLCVDHVGLQVVGTHYIQECHFDLVKLHRSIIHQIHLKSENQLFIRSLIGGLYRAEVQVFAEGVSSFEEWQTLKILGVSAAQGDFFNH